MGVWWVRLFVKILKVACLWWWFYVDSPPRNFLDTSMEEHNTRSLGLNMCKCCNKLWRRLIDRQFASQLTAQASSPEIIIYRVTDPGPVQCSGSSVAAGAGRRENKVPIRGIFLTKWWRKDKTNNQCYFCMNDVKTWYAWNKSKTCK